MTGRWLKTVLATLVVGFVSVGTAAAAPIVVGQWIWTDDQFFGSQFTVTNSSDAPSDPGPGLPLIVPPPAGWQSGGFTNIAVTLTPVGNCPVLVDCEVPIADIGAGTSDFNSDFIDTLAVASATLSLDFLGQTLTSTISAVGDGGLLVYDFTPTQVPEPNTLMLVGTGGAAWLVRRRGSRA